MGGFSILILLGILSAIFYFFIAIFLVVLIYLLITYFFESIAITKMCNNLKGKYSFMAWFPFYNKYLIGKIANSKVEGALLGILNFFIVIMFIYFLLIENFSHWLLLVFFILIFVSFILNILISHKIFKKAIVKYSDLFTVLSVLSLGLLRPIFLFFIRNNKNLFIEVKK